MILCTHPGRYGDLLWALPTMRVLAEEAQQPVDLLLSKRYGAEGFIELLRKQYYVGVVNIANDWEIQETAPITPREPPSIPSGYDRVVHLGYEGWPSQPLPFEIARIAGVTIDLDTPWVAVRQGQHSRIAVGFTEEHFELKVGLLKLLHYQRFRTFNVTATPRWQHETFIEIGGPASWLAAARRIGSARLFVGCCSALHVLACAVRTPVICVEPNPARHHPIFYPFLTEGPRVQLLRGLDGQPTVDSRHLVDTIRARLGGVHA